VGSSLAGLAQAPAPGDCLLGGLQLFVLYLVVRLIGLAMVRLFFVSVLIQSGGLCRGCGYNLTGNTSGVCPECGTPLDPTASSEPLQAQGTSA